MDENAFKVKTGLFEGPLELLLDLIEKRKLLINDVSLGAIADDYVAYVRNLGTFPINEAAQFILVASTLVLIKSRSLLPDLTLTPEEQADVRELEDRLRAYERIRALSLFVKERFGSAFIFPQSTTRAYTPVFVPHKRITTETLLGAAHDILKRLPQIEQLPKALVRKVISLETVIQNLTERIQTGITMRFREFAGVGKREKVDVIIGFLAMLELVKRGLINVKQDNAFHDIHMETSQPTTPHYT